MVLYLMKTLPTEMHISRLPWQNTTMAGMYVCYANMVLIYHGDFSGSISLANTMLRIDAPLHISSNLISTT